MHPAVQLCKCKWPERRQRPSMSLHCPAPGPSREVVVIRHRVQPRSPSSLLRWLSAASRIASLPSRRSSIPSLAWASDSPTRQLRIFSTMTGAMSILAACQGAWVRGSPAPPAVTASPLPAGRLLNRPIAPKHPCSRRAAAARTPRRPHRRRPPTGGACRRARAGGPRHVPGSQASAARDQCDEGMVC